MWLNILRGLCVFGVCYPVSLRNRQPSQNTLSFKSHKCPSTLKTITSLQKRPLDMHISSHLSKLWHPTSMSWKLWLYMTRVDKLFTTRYELLLLWFRYATKYLYVWCSHYAWHANRWCSGLPDITLSEQLCRHAWSWPVDVILGA